MNGRTRFTQVWVRRMHLFLFCFLHWRVCKIHTESTYLTSHQCEGPSRTQCEGASHPQWGGPSAHFQCELVRAHLIASHFLSLRGQGFGQVPGKGRARMWAVDGFFWKIE